MPAPIALFVYNRLEHTDLVVEALKKNLLSKESDLIIFSDASKDESDLLNVYKVRQYIQHIDGFRSVRIIRRDYNYGLAKSIIDGVSHALNLYEKVIVLEDDLVVSEHFLKYMNEALDLYEESPLVASIHGYVYPVNKPLPETFFLLGSDCWGWGVWRRSWNVFNADGKYLLNQLRVRQLVNKFNFDGAYPFSRMLENQTLGKNNSWAIRWYASTFLAGMYTLYPGRSLVAHIGNDGSGTHGMNSVDLDVQISTIPISIQEIEVEETCEIIEIFKNYFYLISRSRLRKLIDKALNILVNITRYS